MRLPWIKVHARLPRHRKSAVLDRLLGRRRTWTHVVELWLWASEEAPTGDLSGLPVEVIADKAGWRGNAQRFVDALREVGFMDGDVLHDWEEEQSARVELAASAEIDNRPSLWRRHATDVFERDGWSCRYCGALCDRPTLDHVEPKSRGGSHDPDNLVTACGPCNSRKGARTPEEAGMRLLPMREARA